MKLLVSLLLSSILFSCAHGHKKEISYKANGLEMKGYYVAAKGQGYKRPGVLVVHEWWGHNEYTRQRAEMLADMGYHALAIDMYGDGKTADHPKQAGEFSGMVMKNMPEAKKRFEAALKTLKSMPGVDQDNIAAIGYCFGGGIVLNMARMGVDLKGVASYHGPLATATPAKKGQVKAEIMVFNGESDPMVSSKDVAQFEKEMKSANAKFKVVNYKGAKHGFTNPEATAKGEKFGLPLAYDEKADKDSWAQTQEFFKRIFK
ncbi:MAG: dienelactone hydrolase family protein [Bacteriovoracaceae bacterium]